MLRKLRHRFCPARDSRALAFLELETASAHGCHLARNADVVMSRPRLLTEVWKHPNGLDPRTVDTHVKRLREKLGDAASVIETVRGFGYRFRSQGRDESVAGATQASPCTTEPVPG